MDESVRLAMRRRHAERGELCACGRMVYGNGGTVSHHRACREYLRKHGYPLDQGMQQAVRSEYGPEGVQRAEREIGRRILDDNLSMRTILWPELRDLIWTCARSETPA